MHFLRRSCIAAAFAMLAACGADTPGDESGASATGGTSSRQLTIASNPAGTHVYQVAAGLAKVLQEEAGIRTTIRPYTGSSVYLPLLQRGEVALGLNISIDGFLSYRGMPPYDTPMRNIRALGMMFPLPIMYMVRADSDLYRVEDLRGQRVVITFRANAALEQLHEGILATGGLTRDDVTPQIVAGLPEAMRMLQEGRSDAVPTGLHTALSMQVDSALPGGIRYLTMGADEAKLAEFMPGSRVITAEPGDNTVGLDGPARVSGIVDYLNTGVHMSDDQAYEIIKTIHQNWEQLRRDYVQMRPVTAEEVVPADHTHPYHPGAIRYWREAGLWTEEHARRQAELLAIHGL